MAPSMFGFQEHRRLFGFSANSSKQKRDGSSCGWRAKKTKQRPTWTRTFVCLAHTDVERMPSVNDNIELKEASLGEKRLTNFLLTTTATILTKNWDRHTPNYLEPEITSFSGEATVAYSKNWTPHTMCLDWKSELVKGRFSSGHCKEILNWREKGVLMNTR